MKVLAELIIAFLDLLETEGRILRRSVVRVGWGLALVFMASLLILIAVGFFLAGIFLYLASQVNSPAAALAVSLVAFLLALIIAGIAHWRVK